MAYVHGYSPRETERLRDQSEILEQLLHQDTKYPPDNLVFEPGSGVGAQTSILLKRNPETRFVSIDINTKSLKLARKLLGCADSCRVELLQGDIESVPFVNDCFDHIFVCFVLEHVSNPLSLLAELKRVVKPKGTITAVEGDHGSCFWHPETAQSLAVWESFIKVQKKLGHDPCVGRKLCSLFVQSGLSIKHTSPRIVYGDARHPELLNAMVNSIIVPMVQTAKLAATEKKFISPSTWETGTEDLCKSARVPDGSFFYSWFKVVAQKE